MKLKLFEKLRLTQPKILDYAQKFDPDGVLNYNYLLSNGGELSAGNVRRPMFWHKETALCCPAFYFHSNPFKTDRSVKPWNDVLLPDLGLVYYNGDNKTPGIRASGVHNSGNGKMEELQDHYFSHNQEDRERAAPIVIFEHDQFKGRDKGYRRFIGYGIVSSIEIRQEFDAHSRDVFSNYLYEVSLFQVPPEGLDWRWIYDRRNPDLGLCQINRFAPRAWKLFISQGLSAVDSIRQRIRHYDISKPSDQRAEISATQKRILDAIVSHYPISTEKGRFEALASLVAAEYFGEHYSKGWITKHSGDMGIDFIGRLDIKNHQAPSPPGTILGGTKLLVLGQAKCRTNYVSPKSSEEDAKDIARVAARLKRGYLGIYVTTGTFKASTQREVAIDGYPMVLINGRQMADLLANYMTRTGKRMLEVLSESDEWYFTNRRDLPPEVMLKELV